MGGNGNDDDNIIIHAPSLIFEWRSEFHYPFSYEILEVDPLEYLSQ